MKHIDLLSGITLLILGAAVFLKSLSYPLGTFRVPGAGLFPLITSILLIGLSASLTLLAVLNKRGEAIAPTPFFPEKGASRRVLLGFASMIGFRYLLPVIGFGPATWIFIFFLIKCLGGYGWKLSLLFSIVSTVAFYYLFQIWLKIPMPYPLLRF